MQLLFPSRPFLDYACVICAGALGLLRIHSLTSLIDSGQTEDLLHETGSFGRNRDVFCT